MNEIEQISVTVQRELGLTPIRIKQRLTQISLTESDFTFIGTARDWLCAQAEQAISDWCARFSKQPFISDPFAGGNAEQKLRENLDGFFKQLFEMRFDNSYIRSRVRTAIAHRRMGIRAEWFTAAYSHLLDSLLLAMHSAPPVPVPDASKLSRNITKIAIFDIGLVQEIHSHVEHMALMQMLSEDPITGLANYNHLASEFDARLRQKPSSAAVFFVGLNRFKAINETLGHSIGNQILTEVAARLCGSTQSDGLICRLGGDIFVIAIFDTCQNEQDCRIVAQDIHHSLNQHYEQDGFSVDLTVSIGVSLARKRIPSANVLMQQAEMALHSAKKHQLPTTVFAEQMKQYSLEHLSLGPDLRSAVDNSELRLYYQPKISAITAEVIGVEALIRWNHPTKGFMPPEFFIPHAEQTVLIHPIAEWVLKNAIAQLAKWQKMGLDIRMAVNLAAPNLQNTHLPDEIDALLKQNGVPPEKLMLEITESGLMADPERGKETLTRFRELGIRLAIDDFGTGYSSLAYLKTLPVHEVKIDRTFVVGMAGNEKDEQIVRATIKLAHSLGLITTAEGVECKEVADKLKLYGCDKLQGFLFAEPMPAKDLPNWIAEYKPISLIPQDHIEGSELDDDVEESAGNVEPEAIQFQDAHRTGMVKIDEQHQALVGTVNRLLEASNSEKPTAPAIKKTLAELQEFLATHFDTEENFLTLHRYPKLEAYVQYQKALEQKLKSFVTVPENPSIRRKIYRVASRWLMDHFDSDSHQFIVRCKKDSE